jgi:hypothetical protein
MSDLSISGVPEQELAPSFNILKGLLRFHWAIPSTFLDKQ